MSAQTSPYEKFLESIAAEWILLPERRAAFQSIGINPEAWPECSAKMALRSFERRALESNAEVARIELGEVVDRLQHEYVPEDNESLSVLYEENLSALRGLHLAESILKDPKKADEYISGFKKSLSPKISTFNVWEELDQVMLEEGKKVQTSQSRKLIPGWEKLSRLIGGFNPGRVSVLIAESGVGKTMCALNLSLCSSKSEPTLFINMEMTKNDIVARFVQMGARIKSEDWHTGAWNIEAIQNLRKEKDERHAIRVTEGRTLSLQQIISLIMIEKNRDEKLGFVVIDYDQKIRFKDRGEEWFQMVRAFEEIEEAAKACDVHIMILAQGSEDGKIKSSKRAIQPASTVFEFVEEGGQYKLVSKKNRFGKRRWQLSVECRPEMSLVTEGDEIKESAMKDFVPWKRI